MGKNNIEKPNDSFNIPVIENIKFDHKLDDTYVLLCTLERVGHKVQYVYEKGWDYLIQSSDGNRYSLGENAYKKLMNKIRAIDKKTQILQSEPFVKSEEPNIHVTCYYKRMPGRIYHYLVEGVFEQGEKLQYVGENLPLNRMMSCFWHVEKLALDKNNATRTTNGGIENNLFYKAALEREDFELALQLKLHYGIATSEDRERLCKLEGKIYLPHLSQEFDRNYYVERKDMDYEILENSEYNLMHRPCIAMHGSTRSVYTLNPHKKSGVDAAPIDAKGITFEEFLKMFENQ